MSIESLDGKTRRSWGAKLVLSVAVAIQLPLFFILHFQVGWSIGLAAIVTCLLTMSLAGFSFYVLHRGIRISLRGLLIGLTLGIVLFGTIGMRLLSSRAQHRAVDQLTGTGASVYYDYDYDAQGFPVFNASPPTGWLVELLGVDYFYDVVRVNIQNGNSSDLQFEQLTKLKACNTLTLRNNVSVSEMAFQHIPNVHGLELLSAETDAITDSHLVSLANAKNITSLNLSYCPKVTDDGLEHVKTMSQLNGLSIGSGQVTSAGISNLVGLKQLKWLSIGGPGIDDKAIEHLMGLDSLESLNLSLSKVTDAGVRRLVKLLTLQSLNLVHTDVSDAGIRELATLPELRRLNLAGTKLTDVGLEHLTQCIGMECLNVDETAVTEQGLAEFRAALPNCRLD